MRRSAMLLLWYLFSVASALNGLSGPVITYNPNAFHKHRRQDEVLAGPSDASIVCLAGTKQRFHGRQPLHTRETKKPLI